MAFVECWLKLATEVIFHHFGLHTQILCSILSLREVLLMSPWIVPTRRDFLIVISGGGSGGTTPPYTHAWTPELPQCEPLVHAAPLPGSSEHTSCGRPHGLCNTTSQGVGIGIHKLAVTSPGEAGFSFRGGVSIEPSGRTPPPPQKGSIDRTPKILPRLTPGPRR